MVKYWLLFIVGTLPLIMAEVLGLIILCELLLGMQIKSFGERALLFAMYAVVGTVLIALSILIWKHARWEFGGNNGTK